MFDYDYDYYYDETYSVERDMVTGRTVVCDEFGDEVATVDSSVKVGDYSGKQMMDIERSAAREARLNSYTYNANDAETNSYTYDNQYDDDQYDSYNNNSSGDGWSGSLVSLAIGAAMFLSILFSF